MEPGAFWDTTAVTAENTHINCDTIQFKKLREEVKINQMPGMFQLGRKDNMEQVCDEDADMFDNNSGSPADGEEVWLQLGQLPSSDLPTAWRI